MIIDSMSSSEPISLIVLNKLLRKVRTIDDLIEKALPAIIKRYPSWRIGWHLVTKSKIFVRIVIPLNDVGSFWDTALTVNEDYLLEFDSKE